jgi:hypothetical protein
MLLRTTWVARWRKKETKAGEMESVQARIFGCLQSNLPRESPSNPTLPQKHCHLASHITE